ncbi:MAG: hypothetical protein RL077_3847, partial [Verrucomicrobiota bacterium]
STALPSGLTLDNTTGLISGSPLVTGRYSVTLSAENAAGAGTASFVLNVAASVPAPANQTITFAALVAKTYGAAAFTLGATASSGLSVTYASANTAVATVSGNTVTIVGVGTTTITASQAGDATYNAAPAVAQTLTVNSSSSVGRLVNLSALMGMPSGGSSATFTLAGSVQKSVLIRAIGPTLAAFGVVGTLVDPQLSLVNATTGALVASNDDWGTPVGTGAATAAQLLSAFNQVGVFALGSGSKDSAVLVSLAPGTYTAQFVGAGGTSGQVLCEIYDADASGTFSGTNLFSYLAFRSPVATGSLTAGVGWSGSSAGSVLVRAVGPSLGSTGALADPSLSLLNEAGSTIATNNDWAGALGLSSAFAQVGAFPFTSASSLDSALISPLSAGGYTVRVAPATGSGGTTLIEVFDLAVTGGGMPYVVTPPAGQTVSAGSGASFSVVAGGAGPITYQWRKGGTAISGATNASYAIGGVVAGDAGTYTVTATNSLGAATSSAAILSLSATGTAPVITTQPVSQAVALGANVTFTVVATGTPTLTYQWRKNGTAINGATNASYTIASVGSADLASYNVVVANSVDGVPSSAAILSLAATGTAPVITTQPVGRLAAIETGVTFSVVASGSAGLTYQWKKDGGVLADGSRTTGSTTATLSVANLGAADAGSYTVVVANGSLSTTSSVAALTVLDVRATHAVGGAGYVPGGTVTVNSTLTYAGPCVGLDWTLLLPEGWTYASGGGAEGETKPPVGTSSLLEWKWTNIPASPVTFSTTLNVPTGAMGAKTLAASAIFRIAAGPLTMMVKPDPLTVSAALYHSADTGRDLRIGLLELTRLIELYNTRIGTARTGCYKIEVGSEDGFSPESTRTASTVVTLASWHSADSNHDGKIGLLELTRVIELYNYRSGTTRTGEYHLQAGTEDGFASGPATPDGMVLIPGDTFTMGSVVASIVGTDKSDGLTDAPPHAVTLSAFYLAKTETTYAEWVAVRTWALDPARGAGVYDFGATLGGGKGDTHPVHSVSWYDVVKWCNAKSEREGLTPVYYTNDAQTAGYVYRTGGVAVTAAQVKWGANGYRLPTEAEWEYAARGGLSGQRFPWGDTITHAQANYASSADYAYDVSTTRGHHPTYATGSSPYTSPVGVFAANRYGLSDMVGNVYEWTWDWYGSYGSGAVSDPRGAASGTGRVYRGGSWGNEPHGARSANRSIYSPGLRDYNIGFRPARSSVP